MYARMTTLLLSQMKNSCFNAFYSEKRASGTPIRMLFCNALTNRMFPDIFKFMGEKKIKFPKLFLLQATESQMFAGNFCNQYTEKTTLLPQQNIFLI